MLGAGISGLSAAWRLSEKGVKVSVLESDPSVGGLAGTMRKDGYCLDVGPHSFFSDDPTIVDQVLALFDGGLQTQPRRVRFYYRGKYLDYPLTARSVLFQMGLRSGVRAAASFIYGKLFAPKKVLAGNATVEEWATASFGEYLYRTFFKPYTEQFWKVPCSELSARAIPTNTRMSFINTLKLLFRQKVDSDKNSLIEREALATYYPDAGFAAIAEKIVEQIAENQGDVFLSCDVSGITVLPDGKIKVSYQENGQESARVGDRVISTLPLPLLIEKLGVIVPDDVRASAEKLKYQSLLVLGMVTEKQNILNCGYTYVLDRPYNRIFEMNEFSPKTSPVEDNILAVEITCAKDSYIYTATKEELFDMCIGSLAEDGFLNPGDVKRLFLIKAEHAYPMYRKDYAVHLTKVMDYLESLKSLVTLGRSGEFRYMDIDECMKRAFDLADRYVLDKTSGVSGSSL